ncbi:MAG TPA: tetratricopeptide repeat protein [Anaerolineales bacterium]
MPPRLVLQFLGLPQLHLDDRPISTDRRKAVALVAYLSVNDIGHAPQRYSRESLSALFWPDYDQAKAFSNLRRTIWEVRQTIGESWLIADRDSVYLNESAEIDLDVASFRDLLSRSRQQSDFPLRIALRADAVKLYRDHFLTGFSLKDAPNFNEWAFAESEELRRQLADALAMLSKDHCALGQADQAIPYARRLVSLDPLNEAAHRQLMEVYLQAGQHSAALKQYQTCEQILRKELGVDPQPETYALYKRIRRGEAKPVQLAKPTGPAKRNPPTGTVTFLFTDIEGSTKLAQQHPDAMAALLARHGEILNQVIQTHNGYVFQDVADSFAAAFSDAGDALNAALAAQVLLHQESWSPVPLKVRMGIHTGATQISASAPTVYTGYATLASTQRIMSAGHGGQILLSGATEALVRDRLPQHVILRDMGEHKFRDVLQPMHVFQVMAPDLQTEFPPLRALDVFPNNLPAQLTSFVGRNKEVEQIKKHLGQCRLVTLTGAGGIGKTRLSIQTASEMLNDFPNGAWLVELAPLSDPALVTQAVVNTLGLIEQAGRSPISVLTDFLQTKRALLILDNCEHLTQACAKLGESLLHSCPDLRILATSREALGISGEITYLIPPLTLPDPIEEREGALIHYEAVELFVERAQTALPGFSITRDNAPVITQICQHLDGIPLAIELAAARVRLLSVEEIAARLDDRFRLLTGGARTALPRHQTLQALIDWSYDILSESERVLFRRLSVFAGGWTLEAAERVAGGEWQVESGTSPSTHNLPPEDILDLLTQLVNKSLVIAERRQGPETRYDMLETIRQYAREKSWQAGEGESLRRRHLAYYVDLAERAEPHLRAPDMVMWLDRLEAEHDNIRSALEWALEGDIEAELRLASALLWFWHIRGHKNEGIEWLERALSIEAMDRDDQPMTPSRTMIRGKALNASGSLMVMNHEFAKAPARLEESLTLFKELGPTGKRGMAHALLRLGSSLPTGDIRAGSLLEQSLALFRELRDKFGIAECLMLLAGQVASLAEKDDDYSQAILFTEEQLALRKEIGDQDGAAVALSILGDLVLSQGDYQKATMLYEEALAGFRAVRNSGAVSLSLIGFGDIFFWRGDYERAAQIYEAALSLAQDLGYKFIIALNMYSLGIIAWFQGAYARAVQLIEESQPMFRVISNHWLIASSLHALGDMALAEGDEARAAQWYEDELAASREAQLDVARIYALEGLGRVAWAGGDYTLARKRFEEALKISRDADIKPAMFHALYHLGRTAQARGDTAAARAFYVEALELQPRRVRLLFRWTWLKTYQSAVAYPLAAFALLAAVQNNMPRAARLLSAAETFYTPLRFEMSARERAEHDQAVAAARTALGKKSFAAAWEEGGRMSLEQAIAYALEDN